MIVRLYCYRLHDHIILLIIALSYSKHFVYKLLFVQRRVVNVAHGYVDTIYNDTQLRCSATSSWPTDDNYTVAWYRRDLELTSSNVKYIIGDSTLIIHKVGKY